MKKVCLILSMIIGTTYLLISCNKDFLNKQPVGALDTSVVANQKGVEAVLIGAYSMLDGYSSGDGGTGGWESAADNWVYGSICGGDAHKGSDATDQAAVTPIEQYNADATNGYFNQKWKAVYDGVFRTNTVLRLLVQATDVSESDRKRIEGEAKFLRGHYHFEAKKMWNKVPYIDESRASFQVSNDPVVPNDADIWPQIEADLQFAYNNLPELQNAVGRANKWSAAAMLGKCLMFQKKYAEAKPILEQVYLKGTNPLGVKYGLVDRYQDNFNAATKNNKESVFSTQSSVNDKSGAANANYGAVLNMPYGGPWDCCGFFQPSQDLVNSFKVNATTGLPDYDAFNTNPVNSDQGLKSSDPFTPYAGTVDPRLDWTVGRRGIPYLDWGPHPGFDWMRDQSYGGPYSPKKNVYYKEQKGKLTDASFWSSTVTAINVNLIRFADVILWLAECEVETGDLNKARGYVNEIRARAAKPVSWVYKDGTNTPAANYKLGLYETGWTDKAFAQKAVYFERKLELGMEGHRFFDLVRWGIAAETLNKYLQYESTLRTYLKGAQFKPNKSEYFPIPQRQIDLSNGGLKQN